MHSTRKTSITSERIALGSDAIPLMTRSFAAGAIALAAAAILFSFTEGGFKRFLFSYHTAFCFLLSISVGALFVVVILNLTRAGWGIVIRRLAELIASVILPMLVLFAPIYIVTVFFGGSELGHTLYIWNNPEFINANLETMFEGKQVFLSSKWFGVRIIAYFLILGLMARYFFFKSAKQDEVGGKAISITMQKAAAPCMILFAFTVVFASFDLEMSLAPRWFSTMFPVYFFAGATMGAFATLIICCVLLQRRGILTDDITEDHYHDLSKLTFAFVFFWGYVGFSQFMLIWYANLPEETWWFRPRLDWSKWAAVSMLLLFGHLLIPFVGMMSRTVRRNKDIMLVWAIALLFFHWLDHYWLVMPQYGADVTGAVTSTSNQLTIDLYSLLLDGLLVIGLGGIYLGMIVWMGLDKNLIPVKDPRLVESLNFKNP